MIILILPSSGVKRSSRTDSGMSGNFIFYVFIAILMSRVLKHLNDLNWHLDLYRGLSKFQLGLVHNSQQRTSSPFESLCVPLFLKRISHYRFRQDISHSAHRLISMSASRV